MVKKEFNSAFQYANCELASNTVIIWSFQFSTNQICTFTGRD